MKPGNEVTRSRKHPARSGCAAPAKERGPTKPRELAALPQARRDSLAGEEGDPGEAEVVRVHKNVLHEEVRTAAMLERERRQTQ